MMCNTLIWSKNGKIHGQGVRERKKVEKSCTRVDGDQTRETENARRWWKSAHVTRTVRYVYSLMRVHETRVKRTHNPIYYHIEWYTISICLFPLKSYTCSGHDKHGSDERIVINQVCIYVTITEDYAARGRQNPIGDFVGVTCIRTYGNIVYNVISRYGIVCTRAQV